MIIFYSNISVRHIYAAYSLLYSCRFILFYIFCAIQEEINLEYKYKFWNGNDLNKERNCVQSSLYVQANFL